MDDFHYAHVLIVEEDEDPEPFLLKAETDRPLVDSVYLLIVAHCTDAEGARRGS